MSDNETPADSPSDAASAGPSTPAAGAATGETPGLSKRAQKRLAKKEKWEEGKAERRAEERKRRKLNKQAARAKREEDVEKGLITREELIEELRAKSRRKAEDADPYDVGVIVDLGFDELMTDKVSGGSSVLRP